MFVLAVCPCCGEKRISKVEMAFLEQAGIEDLDGLQRFVLENLEVISTISLDEFVNEIRPYMVEYSKLKNMTEARNFLVHGVGVARSSVEDIIQSMQKDVAVKTQVRN